ncbi:hypothetical protein HAX54_049933, partial [Datura stramonium]|nr:hypothetical protein [Datura stramonium]
TLTLSSLTTPTTSKDSSANAQVVRASTFRGGVEHRQIITLDRCSEKALNRVCMTHSSRMNPCWVEARLSTHSQSQPPLRIEREADIGAKVLDF